MGRKLYVGNLPYQTGETELTELFSRAGSVAVAALLLLPLAAFAARRRWAAFAVGGALAEAEALLVGRFRSITVADIVADARRKGGKKG